jgi:hypothetical protein
MTKATHLQRAVVDGNLLVFVVADLIGEAIKHGDLLELDCCPIASTD